MPPVQTASNSGGISTDGLPPVPAISLRTIPMAGILVDVYGLDELPPSVTKVSCLWLHHQRTRNKEHMREIATRCVSAWNESLSSSSEKGERGLIALAYDQRNHGTRLVHDPANGAWREGNKTHAQDMLGGIVGMVGDQRVLLDVVESYLFHETAEEGKQRKVIDHHLALGVSLGGHSVWQLMFADPRVRAGVAVIGCPDYMNLITDRARLSKLSTYSAETGAATFLGSKDFPPSLVEAACRRDPKGILFGTSPIPSFSSSDEEESQRRQILIKRLQGKQFLLCNGAEDKLVPPRCGESFTRWFKEAADKYKEARISVDERTYAGVGHTFSVGMVKDAVEWVKEVVKGADADIAAQARSGKSKI